MVVSHGLAKILEILGSQALLSRYQNPEDSGSFLKSCGLKSFQILVALGGYSRGNIVLQIFGGNSSVVLAEPSISRMSEFMSGSGLVPFGFVSGLVSSSCLG